MWICLNNAFLSIVAKREDANTLLVRARIKGHIEAVFPDAEVFTNEGSDYLFRAYISRLAVANKIAEKIEGITYDNFKSSVRNKSLHDAYLKFWGVMAQLQDRFNLTFTK